MAYLLIPAVFWVVFFISFFRNRARMRNAFYLFAALAVSAITAVLFVADAYADIAVFVFAVMVVVVLLSVPVMLVLNGITMIRNEGRSIPNLLSMLFGILIGAGEIAFIFAAISTYGAYQANIIYRLITAFGCAVFYLSVVFVCFMIYTLFIQIIPHVRDFDYLVVHGCGLLGGERVSKLLSDRLDKAIKVYRKDKTKPKIIASGGQGPDEKVSEAKAMAKYLAAHGVNPEDIIEEDRSMDTRENIINSKKIIDAQEGRKRTALISSNYHVYRCLVLAKQEGLRCTGIGSHVAWYYWPSALIREFVAVIVIPENLILFLIGLIVSMVPAVLI
ncbi:MAG: YdcF family protein [Solobacterium sp.]|nr:YdcF family protein [Solobacterium sp.]